MKVGILSLPLHTNYGGILQSYALYTILKRLGHDVKVIDLDRKPNSVSLIKNLYLNAYYFLAHLKRGKIFFPKNFNNEAKRNYSNFKLKTKNTSLFIDKYIETVKVRDYVSDLQDLKFDAIVVGSDQIWNLFNGSSISGNVANAFLPHLSDKQTIKLSYAASFGKDIWEYDKKTTNLVKDAIKEFKAVSVRELSGINLCESYLNVNAVQHLDPTMLLSKIDYMTAINLNSVKKSPGNLLVYILDSTEEKSGVVTFIERKMNLKSFVVNSRVEDMTSKCTNIEEMIQPPVENWLRGFLDAEFIVTDSFHACVFSILFQKNFVVIGNKERGMARFESLLQQFNLSNRLITSVDDLDKLDIQQSIDYEYIEMKLNSERDRSLNYLKANLQW